MLAVILKLAQSREQIQLPRIPRFEPTGASQTVHLQKLTPSETRGAIKSQYLIRERPVRSCEQISGGVQLACDRGKHVKQRPRDDEVVVEHDHGADQHHAVAEAPHQWTESLVSRDRSQARVLACSQTESHAIPESPTKRGEIRGNKKLEGLVCFGRAAI